MFYGQNNYHIIIMYYDIEKNVVTMKRLLMNIACCI